MLVPSSTSLLLFLPTGGVPTVQIREFSLWDEKTCASHAEHPSIIALCFSSPLCLLWAHNWQGKGVEKMVLFVPARTWLLKCE